MSTTNRDGDGITDEQIDALRAVALEIGSVDEAMICDWARAGNPHARRICGELSALRGEPS